MDAKLDRITEQLKALPLLTQQLGGHQDRLEELSKRVAVAAALVDDVKKEQAAAARARALGAPVDSGGYFRLAKLKFPTFNGTFPRLWITQCTRYFKFYAMPMEMWVTWASMHMEGRADLWMMNYEKHHEPDWVQFCQAVEQRFGADDYRLKITALTELRQEGTVSEYRDQFEERMYHVMLFNSGMDKTFYLTLFVNGLREEIRDVLWLHFPASVDEAANLALLQEKVYDRAMQRSQRDPFEE